MINLTFYNGRSNSEQFVIKVKKNLVIKTDDFVRASQHGITKVELKSNVLNLSSDTGEISFKDIVINSDYRRLSATQFNINPLQASLDKITDSIKMELIINETEHIAFIDVLVK